MGHALTITSSLSFWESTVKKKKKEKKRKKKAVNLKIFFIHFTCSERSQHMLLMNCMPQ